MAQDRSKAALLNFIAWLGDKGYLPANSATARKIVATKVFADLTDEEAADVTQLDLDSVMARFENRNRGKYGAHSLRTYQSRLRNSIRDFSRYAEDPLSFQPKKSSGSIVRPKPKLGREAPSAAAVKSETTPALAVPSAGFDVNVLPIPLRENLTLKIVGLPFDLSPSEAKKIANIILAHVSE